MLRENPYAEWYLNSMRIPGSPTQRPRPVYGDDFPYDNFVAPSTTPRRRRPRCHRRVVPGGGRPLRRAHDQAPRRFRPLALAVAHPVKGEYHARRDLVGDLGEAVRAQGMRMGLYYSGGYDWPYNDAVLPRRPTPCWPRRRAALLDYVTAHVRELVDRYQPSVLWNDIGWPRDPRCRNSSPATTTRWRTAS